MNVIPQIRNYSREDTRPDGTKHVYSADLLASRSTSPSFKFLANKVYEVLERSIPYEKKSTTSSDGTSSLSARDKRGRVPSTYS